MSIEVDAITIPVRVDFKDEKELKNTERVMDELGNAASANSKQLDKLANAFNNMAKAAKAVGDFKTAADQMGNAETNITHLKDGMIALARVGKSVGKSTAYLEMIAESLRQFNDVDESKLIGIAASMNGITGAVERLNNIGVRGITDMADAVKELAAGLDGLSTEKLSEIGGQSDKVATGLKKATTIKTAPDQKVLVDTAKAINAGERELKSGYTQMTKDAASAANATVNAFGGVATGVKKYEGVTAYEIGKASNLFGAGAKAITDKLPELEEGQLASARGVLNATQAAKNLPQAMLNQRDIGKTNKSGMLTGELSQEATQAANTFGKALEALKAQVVTFDTASQKAAAGVKDLANAMKRIADIGEKANGFDSAAEKVANFVNYLANEKNVSDAAIGRFERLATAIGNLTGNYNKLNMAQKQAADAMMSPLAKAAENGDSRISAAVERMKNAQSAILEAQASGAGNQRVTRLGEDIAPQLEKAKQQISDLNEAVGANGGVVTEKMARQYESVATSVEALARRMSRTVEDEYAKMGAAAERDADREKKAAQKKDQKSPLNLRESRQGASNPYGNSKAMQAYFANASKTYGRLMREQEKRLAAFAKSMGSVLPKSAQAVQKAMSAAGRSIASFGRILMNVASSPFRMAANSAMNFIRALNRMKRMGASALFFNTMFKALTILSNGLKTGTNNMYQWALATGNSFQSTMDTIATSLQYLTNSIAGLTAPILDALAPVLDSIIDKVVSFVNVLSQLIAMITGASTWRKAIKTQKAFGEAAGAAGNGAKSGGDNAKKGANAAKKALDDYKNTVMGFDELNKLNDVDDHNSGGGRSPEGGKGGGGGGGGAGGEDYGVMFEEVPIADWIEDLKNKSDWSELGKMFTDKLADAMESIDWAKIQGQAYLWATRFGTILNGAFANKRFWSDLGYTIAEGLNTATLFANTFTDTGNWSDLGDSLAIAIRVAVQNIDWRGLGRTLTNGLRIMLEVLHGFVSNWSPSDWAFLGASVRDMAVSALENINWREAIPDMVEFATGVVTALAAVVNNDDGKWDTVTEAIGDGIGSADWAGLWDSVKQLVEKSLGNKVINVPVKVAAAFALTKATTAAIGALAPAIVKVVAASMGITTWADVGAAIELGIEALGGSVAAAIPGIGIGVAIGAAIIGAIKLGAMSPSDWDSFRSGLQAKLRGAIDAVNQFMASLPGLLGKGLGMLLGYLPGLIGRIIFKGLPRLLEVLVTVGAYIVEGIGEGIISFVTHLPDFIFEFIDAVIEGFKAGFGIHSPSTVMRDEVGKFISGGLLEGILDGLGNIKKWIKKHIVEPFKAAAKSKIEFGVALVQDGWNTVKEWFEKVGGVVGGAVEVGISLVKKGWSTITAFVGNSVRTFISLVKSGWTTITKFVGSAVSVGIGLFKSGWSTLSSFVGTAVSVGISIFKSGWTSIKTFIGTAVSVAISVFKSGWSSLGKFIGTALSVGISLFKSGWTSLSSWIGTKVSVGISLFKSGWTNLKKFFGFSGGGIATSRGIKLVASGGVFNGSFWESVPHYAGGTRATHGTAFVAGESGPEIVGHINGRTEVINRFQMASIMYSSVYNAVSNAAQYVVANIMSAARAEINAVSAVSSQIADIDPFSVKNMNKSNFDSSAYEMSIVGDVRSALSGRIGVSSDISYDDIVSAVATGVAGGMSMSGTNGSDRDINITMRIGNEDIARATYRGNMSLARRGVITPQFA